ncbi:terminase large subunit [Vibrio phage BONAISHI]|nr:terminase large subunit [Vibrio phage BONAISHI]
MILFLDDWKKYPTAIYDDTTTNQSFIRLVETYYRMGIKNHLFPLALYQPALKGVDPFSPDLTIQQHAMITAECKHNPWYFFREVSRVPAGGGDPIQFRASRANIAMYWSFFNHIDYSNIQPRQCGKSVAADVLNNWLLNLAAYNVNIQLYTHSRSLRAENIARLKKIRDTLPGFMNYYDPRRDADNTEMLTCLALKNKYLTAVAQKDKDQAHNLGRGMTVPIFQGDEIPFCPNLKTSYPVIMGATTAAREIAHERGSFYGNLITTTAGDLLTESGRFAYKLINNGMPWDERILDCANIEEAHEMVRANSRDPEALMINGTFSALQVGKTMEWLKSAISKAKGTPEDARRDYLNEWTADTTDSPLPKNVHEALRKSITERMHTDANKYNYMMYWYIPQGSILNRLDDCYTVLTLDTANMIGRDANGLVLQDLRSMEVLATSEVKEGSLTDYGHWISDLLIAYPKMTLVIEHKSSATGMIDTITSRLIAAGYDPFTRIFNQVVDQPEKYERQWQDVSQGIGLKDYHYATKFKNTFGFNTSGKNRDALYGQVLHRATTTCSHLVKDETLVNQLRQLVKKNGRIDHPEGGHDDLVISWLLGHWFATNARNLHFYGIPAGYTQSLVRENGSVQDEDELEKLRVHKELLAKIDLLKEQLLVEKNEIVRQSIELKVHSLVDKIPDESARGRILDDVFKELEEKRRSKTSLKDALRRNRKQSVSWY